MEVIAYTLHALDVCLRLEEWTKQPTSKPLISQAQRQVAKLVAEVRRFAEELLNQDTAAPSPAEESVDRLHYVSENFFERLSSVKALLLRGTTLLDFCSTVEQDGDDGALNAAFSSIYISNDTSVELGSIRHHMVKRERFCREVHKLFSSKVGQGAASLGWWWSTPSKLLLATLILGDILPDSNSFLNQFSAQCFPRYVHTYDHKNNSPYIVDALVPPTTGSYGIVQKVVHNQTRESFAKKTFEHVFSKSQRKKILRELAILELCVHRNVVQLIEAYEMKGEPQTIHIVMTPWAPYTMLDFLLNYDTNRKKKCPWFEPNVPESDVCIFRIMYEMADAVDYLHRLSIKHKDIKPENILLYREGTTRVTPIVTDVGVSKIYRRGASTDYTESTWPYLSLEQLRGEESSLKSDIWQLGCCFAMLLAVARGGRPAVVNLWTTFDRTDGNCTCNIAQQSVPFLRTLKNICVPGSHAQEHAHGVVRQMLELQPSDRSSIELVKIGLERLPKN